MKKNHLIALAVILLILIIDQVVKIWIKTSFSYTDEPENLIGDWFVLNYVENQGMAFGATLGGGIWGKLLLSSFRLIAIIVIAVYLHRQIVKGAKTEFIVVISLVLAGASGNLIDSMFYDYLFEFNPCISFNQLEGSGIFMDCNDYGFAYPVEVRNTGFLFGNVVDMFQFDVNWPQWVPWLGGGQIFPAIWNIADGAISVAVIVLLFRQKAYFPKEPKTPSEESTTHD